MRKALFLILLILFSINGFAQLKYEREIRIKEREVPVNALNFVEALNFNTKIRWYKEIGENQVSFEAKTRFKGEKYSIEFSDEGTFEDIEIEISPEKMPVEVLNKIEENLNSTYNQYTLQKVQIQFSGNPEVILANFPNRETIDEVDISYEIVLSTKLEGSYVMFEYLFSETGEYVQKSRIIEKSINNIIY